MNFLKVLHGRQTRNDNLNEVVFEDHSVDLSLSRLGCHVNDQFTCIASDENGYTQYMVPPFVSKFRTVPNQDHVMAVADEDGIISIVDTCQSSEECCIMRFRAHNNAIFDLCWVYNEKMFVTVSGDQTAILWDVPRKAKISVFEGHTRTIKSVDFRPQDTAIFATGSRDGDINIWDTRSQNRGSYNKADIHIRNSHCAPNATIINNCPTSGSKKKKQAAKSAVSIDGLRGVTAVLFQDENTLISSGAADGMIKCWDLRKSYSIYRNDPLPKYTLPYAGKSLKTNGYSNLLLDSSGTRLFASCTDDVIYQFNSASYEPEPVSAYFGHKNSTFFVKSVLCPREKYILSGSSDNRAYIWCIDKPGYPQFQLSGHSAEVTSVDWCKDPHDQLKLVTCCDDMMFRIWRPRFTEDDDILYNGSCKRMRPELDQLLDNYDSNFWMTRVNGFEKYRRSTSDSSIVGVVGKSSSSSSSAKALISGQPKRSIYRTTEPSTPIIPVSENDHQLRPKRARLNAENSTITPMLSSELDTTRKAVSSKRILTGKCLFIDAPVSAAAAENDVDVDQNLQTPRKKQRTISSIESSSASIVRSPFKEISSNENSPTKECTRVATDIDEEQDFRSPTINLPNSLTDGETVRNVTSQRRKRPMNSENWLSKLASLKRKKASIEDVKQPPRQTKKKAKTSTSTQPIAKYFHSISNGASV